MVTTSTVFAVHLARAHGAAIAAFHGECQKSYELLSDKQRAELAVEQATRETRLAHDQAARARDALAALVAQVRSLEDRPDLRDAQRDLLRTATSALDALATRTESPTVLPTLACRPAPPPSRRPAAGQGHRGEPLARIGSRRQAIDDTPAAREAPPRSFRRPAVVDLRTGTARGSHGESP